MFDVNNSFQRAKAIDYETQPYPHDLPPIYSQTILLPITIRSTSNNTTPTSSGYNTPRITEVEDSIKYRTQSANIYSSQKLVDTERKICSADHRREEDMTEASGKQWKYSNLTLRLFQSFYSFYAFCVSSQLAIAREALHLIRATQSKAVI